MLKLTSLCTSLSLVRIRWWKICTNKWNRVLRHSLYLTGLTGLADYFRPTYFLSKWRSYLVFPSRAPGHVGNLTWCGSSKSRDFLWKQNHANSVVLSFPAVRYASSKNSLPRLILSSLSEIIVNRKSSNKHCLCSTHSTLPFIEHRYYFSSLLIMPGRHHHQNLLWLHQTPQVS